MARLPLPQVTLCAVDTQAPALTMLSLLRSMAGIDFSQVLLFTHNWLPHRVVPGVQIIDIGPLASDADRSQFILRQLPAHIRSSHALITQWDGFVVDPGAWSDAFLVHDFIGAVWPEAPADRQVGSGGFSLRSRRYLAAGKDPRITRLHPEDQALGVTYRAQLEDFHGISFAPPALARRFAWGDEASSAPAFGFHGAQHLPQVLNAVTMAQWLPLLPMAFYAEAAAPRLARALLARGMPVLAQHALQRCQSAGQHGLQTQVLGAAATLMNALKPVRP
jgi:hypothetical protein